MIEINSIIERQKKLFDTGQTRDVHFRLKCLKALKQSVKKHEQDIMNALGEDLGKPEFESYATEIGVLQSEITHVIKNLGSWAKPQKVRTPAMHFKASSYVFSEPYGVALVIAPWNYPFQLLILPLVGALAAGNCAVLKPSEYTLRTSEVIKRIVADSFEDDHVCVVEGGPEVSTELLKQKFDYIFFTGSVPVGRIVMEAAARNLTPVTLELGGKSPCIVDKDAKINTAAKRIIWGKFVNAGQTCVAPDYLLVHKSTKGNLLEQLKLTIRKFYGDFPAASPDYARIINTRHFDRLISLLDRGRIVAGGDFDRDNLYIAPTIIDDISWDDPIMEDEIFGPILPVLVYNDLAEVISLINERPRPLTLYYFSEDKKAQQIVINNISYGGGCINDTLLHLATPYLPFGGVGSSGMGSYHGKAGFDIFSHKKSVLDKSTGVDIPLRYPPYRGKIKILRKILK